VPPESVLEGRFFRLLRELPDLGPIVLQARFPWRARVSHRCDVLLPRSRLVLEADGRLWHARVRDFERDRERDNEAIAHGYGVLRFTWRHITRERRYVLNTIERTARIRTLGAA
jgi:very-short-patch-repair endonuclease